MVQMVEDQKEKSNVVHTELEHNVEASGIAKSSGNEDNLSENSDNDNSAPDFSDNDLVLDADLDDENSASEDEMMLVDDLDDDQPQKGSSEAFSEAMTRILASSLKGSDKKQPILARSKGAERKIEDERIEYKARKVLAAEKKARLEKGHVIPDYKSFDYEKRLRKVATRGVVKLFNAIRTQQKMTDDAVRSTKEVSKTARSIEKAKNMSQMSKSSFLDLLKNTKQTE